MWGFSKSEDHFFLFLMLKIEEPWLYFAADCNLHFGPSVMWWWMYNEAVKGLAIRVRQPGFKSQLSLSVCETLGRWLILSQTLFLSARSGLVGGFSGIMCEFNMGPRTEHGSCLTNRSFYPTLIVVNITVFWLFVMVLEMKHRYSRFARGWENKNTYILCQTLLSMD